jgi:hypothetical protein
VDKRTSNLLISVGVILFAIIIIYIVIIRNPKLLDFLKNLTSRWAPSVRVVAVRDPTDPQIGESVPGPNVYPVVGGSIATADSKMTIRSSGTSFRDNQGFDCSKCNREATWIFNTGEGGDWSIRMGSHGGGSGNGSLIEWTQNYDGSEGRWRCEGPHNTYGQVNK